MALGTAFFHNNLTDTCSEIMLSRGGRVIRQAQRQSVRFTSLESIENPEQRNLEKIRRYQKFVETKGSYSLL